MTLALLTSKQEICQELTNMETTLGTEIYNISTFKIEDIEKIVSTFVVIPNFVLNPMMLLTLRRVTSIQLTTKILIEVLKLQSFRSKG